MRRCGNAVNGATSGARIPASPHFAEPTTDGSNDLSGISWWHRNVARAQYGLQGWKRGRNYPDFIFAAGGQGASRRLVALETKGDHLRNPDTDYKRDLLEFLTDNFDWNNAVPAGQLQLQKTGETVECALILMQDINTQLPKFLEDRAGR